MTVFEFVPNQVRDCKVIAWIHTKTPCYINGGPAVIICPGGGYDHLSEREAEPVAKPYFAAGYNVFILYYSIGLQARHLQPLIQLASTVAHIRNHDKEMNTDPCKIAVCGFSAGGHLACSLGTLFDDSDFLRVFARTDHIRPDAMILSYPVITADEYASKQTIEMVSGAKVGTERYCWFDLTRHVSSNTPPTFLWHTAPDAIVPVENSLKFAMSLSMAKVPFEYHVFPNGGHGMSVCTEEVGSHCEYNQRWLHWSITWLNNLFNFVR